MRTLKNILLHFRDLWLILLIKIPVNLAVTFRGRLVLLVLIGLAIALGGLHFWNAEKLVLPAPNRVEKLIEASGLNCQVVFTEENIFSLSAGMYYSSAEEFVKSLKTGQQVSAGYYLEKFSKLGSSHSEFADAVKVYSANDKFIFIDRFSGRNNREFTMMRYSDKDSVTLVNISDYDNAIAIWIFGGLSWAFGLLIVVVIHNGD